MSSLFGTTSDFKELVTRNGLTSGFYIEKNTFYNYFTLDITAESDKADIFIEEFLPSYYLTLDELGLYINSLLSFKRSYSVIIHNIYIDLYPNIL